MATGFLNTASLHQFNTWHTMKWNSNPCENENIKSAFKWLQWLQRLRHSKNQSNFIVVSFFSCCYLFFAAKLKAESLLCRNFWAHSAKKVWKVCITLHDWQGWVWEAGRGWERYKVGLIRKYRKREPLSALLFPAYVVHYWLPVTNQHPLRSNRLDSLLTSYFAGILMMYQ